MKKISISLQYRQEEKWGERDKSRAKLEARISLPNPGGRSPKNTRRVPSFGKPIKSKEKKKTKEVYTKDDVSITKLKNGRYKFVDPSSKVNTTDWSGIQKLLREHGIKFTSNELEKIKADSND